MLRKYFITLSLTLGFGYTLSLQEAINLTLNANLPKEAKKLPET